MSARDVVYGRRGGGWAERATCARPRCRQPAAWGALWCKEHAAPCPDEVEQVDGQLSFEDVT